MLKRLHFPRVMCSFLRSKLITCVWPLVASITYHKQKMKLLALVRGKHDDIAHLSARWEACIVYYRAGSAATQIV